MVVVYLYRQAHPKKIKRNGHSNRGVYPRHPCACKVHVQYIYITKCKYLPTVSSGYPYPPSVMLTKLHLPMYYIGYMPQVSVYIREEDYPTWKAIPKKAEWLHSAMAVLQNEETLEQAAKLGVVIKKDRQDYSKTLDIPACCKQKRPCKHWAYDPLNQEWTNTISGEVKKIEV